MTEKTNVVGLSKANVPLEWIWNQTFGLPKGLFAEKFFRIK